MVRPKEKQQMPTKSEFHPLHIIHGILQEVGYLLSYKFVSNLYRFIGLIYLFNTRNTEFKGTNCFA